MTESKADELCPIEMTIDVIIPHEEYNFFVGFPDEPEKWARELKKNAEDDGHIRMRITTQNGSGGTKIAFGFHDDSFCIIVTKKRLGAIMQALQIAFDNYID